MTRNAPPIAATPSTVPGYRDRWQWDSFAWGTHCVDCYPGNCLYRVYVRDGKVQREETSGTLPVLVPGVPDRNPMGCQKGAGWSRTLTGDERVLFPLKRAGERGEGRWQRVSWDSALGEIADSILDTIETEGPESILRLTSAAEGGITAGWSASRLFSELLGINSTDINGDINDFSHGQFITWGKFHNAISPESKFQSELILFWYSNPAYTGIPLYHFISEARYRGAEVVLIAPDCSPSHSHADYFVPVKIGSDAALVLSMCRVILDEGLFDPIFVREQTDLPLLVRRDTGRFLRESDCREGGRDNQFYWLAGDGTVQPAPRDSLASAGASPLLSGSALIETRDGVTVEAGTVFDLLRDRLSGYAPGAASEACGVHPDVIRMLARKVASRRTFVERGMSLVKHYHGDLMERSMLLLLALTGNWGRTGAGMWSWSLANFDGPNIMSAKQGPGIEAAERALAGREQMVAGIRAALRAEDPAMTDEGAAVEMAARLSSAGAMRMVPPAFFWYYHCGYRENWNNPAWNDPAMTRPFSAYVDEAVDRGWWQGVARPGPEATPRVLIEAGGNLLRRQRGGQNQLLEHLWPKLRTIVTVDWRLSTTAMLSDYVLPAAQHYEKLTFHMPSVDLQALTFSDRAAPPAGESKPEWEIFGLLARVIEERAAARGLSGYNDANGLPVSLENLGQRFSHGLQTEEQLVEEWMRDTALTGSLEPGIGLAGLREKGFARIDHIGETMPHALNQASDIEPGTAFVSLRWHTEKKLPYPTLTGRAQFYIDQEWFMEAGEALPCHKESPKMGGDYPFELTSGHSRWSIHSMNITNELMLETHRGRPHAVINSADAVRLGIADDAEVRVWNDVGEFRVHAKVSPSARPGQVIVYNGWDPYQFPGWRGPMDLEPGMVKWLHFAGGYGHLRYWPVQWQPVPIDRGIRVQVAPLPPAP